jgi:transcriptional regulator with XRE-family HTH domain
MLDVQPLFNQSSEPHWTRTQQRLLQVLQREENRQKSIREICKLAGYTQDVSWYEALRDPNFVEVLEALGVTVQRRKPIDSNMKRHEAALSQLKETQQRIWEVLQNEENHRKPIYELCTLANCSWDIWKKAFEDESFVARVEELRSWSLKRRKKPEHYPRHCPADFYL